MSSDAAELAAAEANYFETWRMITANAPGGAVEETDELLFTSVPVPVAYFNSAFVKPPADPRRCLDQAREFFGDRNVPYTVRYRENEFADLPSDGTSPLMVAPVGDIGPPAATDIRVVDANSWADHVATIAAGFAMPLGVLTSLFTASLLDTASYAGFIAYDASEPVSTAALIVTDGVAGIYNVATPEPFRGRGFGEATTAAAVAEGARRGCTRTTLQASAMGYPLYERMGFRSVARWHSFTGA